MIEDCELALCQDSQNVKAYNLKGIAFIEKGKKIPSEINQITLGKVQFHKAWLQRLVAIVRLDHRNYK